MDRIIDYREMTLPDLHRGLLSDFLRFQETYKVWYKTDVGYSVKDDHFIDYWDEEKKGEVIEDLRRCLHNGGAVFGAWDGRNLVGFAAIEGRLFGSECQYVELSYIHVSTQQRGYGIGRELFRFCRAAAKRMGAAKIYIAAHPSIESQKFYKKMGCTYALEVNEEIYIKEPLDIQMELKL